MTKNALVLLSAGRTFLVDSQGRVAIGFVTCPISASLCPAVQARFAVVGHPTDRSYAKIALLLLPGQRGTLRLPLTKSARDRLKRKHGAMQVRAVIRSGSSTAVQRTLTLRRP